MAETRREAAKRRKREEKKFLERTKKPVTAERIEEGEHKRRLREERGVGGSELRGKATLEERAPGGAVEKMEERERAQTRREFEMEQGALSIEKKQHVPKDFRELPLEEQKASLEKLTPEEQIFTQPERKEILPEQPKERTILDIIEDIAFGNLIEKDVITGERRIDPDTGKPIEVVSGVVPFGVGGAAAGVPTATKVGVLSSSISKIRTAAVTSKLIALGKTLASHPILTAVGGFILGTAFIGPAKSKFVSVTDPLLELQNKGPFIQQSYNTLGESITEVETDEMMTSQDKIKYYDNTEKLINMNMQGLVERTKESKRLKASAEYVDMLTDFKEKREQVILARNRERAKFTIGERPLISEEAINSWFSSVSSKELDEVAREYEKQIKIILRIPE